MEEIEGRLSVSLGGPDDRVTGGEVALMGVCPIQIVIGSFMPSAFQTSKQRHISELWVGTVVHVARGAVTEANPISQAAPDIHVFPCTTPHPEAS